MRLRVQAGREGDVTDEHKGTGESLAVAAAEAPTAVAWAEWEVGEVQVVVVVAAAAAAAAAVVVGEEEEDVQHLISSPLVATSLPLPPEKSPDPARRHAKIPHYRHPHILSHHTTNTNSTSTSTRHY